MNIFECLKKPAESLYDKKCTIYEYIIKRNDETGIDSTYEVEKYKDISCRISYERTSNADQTETGAQTEQSISLFCSPEFDIKAGSRIVCGDMAFKSSGEPAKYISHQRIELISEGRWA